MKLRSLSMRITLLVGVAAVLVIGLAALLMDHLVDVEMQRRFDDSLLAQARSTAALAEAGPHGLVMDNAGGQATRLLAGKVRVTYAIRCQNGSVLTSRPAPGAYPGQWAHSARDQARFSDVNVAHELQRAVWFAFQTAPADDEDEPSQQVAPAGMPCSIVMLQSREELDDILLTIDAILWLTPLLALLAVLALSPLLIRRGLKPLTVLGENMRSVGPQALGQRLAPTGTRELEPLVDRFNEVLVRMDEGVMRERRFADALAHETRTRLAELRALSEIEQRYPSGRPVQSLLADVGGIGAELENIVSGLLLLTRLDAGIESMEWRTIRLDALIEKQLGRFADLLRRRSVQVDIAAADTDTTVVADPSLLGILVGNLLGNAAAYTPSGEVIDVVLDAHSLRIRNRAPDVDANEVGRFGQRYWSKHHGADGHAGLGLSLAGAAAAALGFELTFSLDAENYLVVVLSWPSASEAHKPAI